MSKATITFEDNSDELTITIDFDGTPDAASMAHIAAAACYVQTTKKIQEGQDNADATKA